MARPRKAKVDYFPHYVHHGKTVFILESQFGNDGYSFLYKLLETLSDSENHILDVRNQASWMFLLSKARVDEVSGTKMLDILSDLEFIDAELWKKRIVWCGNLVENLKDVYDKRTSELPQKPDPRCFRFGNDNQPPVSDPEKEVSDTGNPQSKVKEIKQKHSKDDLGHSPDKPPKPPKRNPVKKLRSMPVIRYQEITKCWPNSVQIELIDSSVTEDTADVTKWEDTIKAWMARGYNPKSVDRIIEWFCLGIPPNGKPGYRQPQTEPKGFSGIRDWPTSEVPEND